MDSGLESNFFMTAVAERFVVGMTASAKRNDLPSRKIKTVSVGILDNKIPTNSKWTIYIDQDFDRIIHTALSLLKYIR